MATSYIDFYNQHIEDLKKEGYEAIFIAVGAHISMRLEIPGEDLKGVYHGVEFLRRVKKDYGLKVKKVVIF